MVFVWWELLQELWKLQDFEHLLMKKRLPIHEERLSKILEAGYASTSTTPLGRSGKLREVADLVAFYISDRSSYITGVTTNIAGGKTRG